MNYSFIDRYKNSDFVPAGNLIYDNDTRPKNDIKNYNYWSIKQDKDNWATDNSIQKTLLQGTYTPTPLGELFFSRTNIERLQKLIKKEVYVRTDGKYKLDVEQDESDLLVVMRAVYITDSYNDPYKLVHQVKELNNKTIERILPDMISMIKQDDEYLKVIDRPIDPIPLPVNVSRAGRLSLPSVTTTFF